MERIPPTLKTGFGESLPVTGSIDKASPLGQRLISLVFVLVKRAASTAALYCKHAQREIVTPRDIKLALKYHAKTFFDIDGIADLEQDMLTMEELVKGFASEQATSGDVVDSFCADAEEIIEEEDDDGEEDECKCDTCRMIRELDWDAWNPTDPAEAFLKKHIDELSNME